MTRISVLMPMQNAEPYVGEAVSSVLSQADTGIELIVVDDGSTDRSRQIVESFHDPRVRILPGLRRGFAAAWNTALAAASGEFVMQCDADDMFSPGRLTLQRTVLQERPEFGAVCGGFSALDRRGRFVARLVDDRPMAEEITEELLSGVTRTTLCSFAIRREHVTAFDGKRGYFETGSDIDFQLRLAERCRIWYEPTDVYRYRLHDRSMTHTVGRIRRSFFDEYARELRRQRAEGRRDDLELGVPRLPPASGEPSRSGEQIQGMLLRRAWQSHDQGDRLEALGIGLRAIKARPRSAGVWSSVGRMLITPAAASSDAR